MRALTHAPGLRYIMLPEIEGFCVINIHHYSTSMCVSVARRSRGDSEDRLLGGRLFYLYKLRQPTELLCGRRDRHYRYVDWGKIKVGTCCGAGFSSL